MEVATKAATLLNSVQKCTFLIADLVMQRTSGIILPVSKLLQKTELDIFAVIELIDSVLDILRQNIAPNIAQDLERLLEIDQEDIGPRAAVVPEVQCWVNKWKKENASTVPSSAIETLCACHADIYPNVYILLTILGTLPVSAATSERSFSTMRRLRSTIGNEQMTGLALLSIQRPTEKIMNDFVASSNRRSDFVL